MASTRIYVDTSVLGGCFDAEFAPWSNGLVEDFRRGTLRAVLSDVTAEEIRRAPATVQAVHQELVSLGAELVRVSPVVLELVAAYEGRAILGPRYRNDLLHIALATVATVDVLVSWNFRHIVRLDRIQLFNEVNAALGRGALTIYSPREVTSYGRNETDSGS